MKSNNFERYCSITQSCPTPCDSMDCSPPGSSVHGILQARILEWVAISFSWEILCIRKYWCVSTAVLKKTLKSPLDCKEIQPVHSEGDQPWDFFGRNDAEAETPVLWPPHGKSWLIGKHSEAGRDWGQEEKGMTEDEMAGWHHWLDGLESEWTPGVGDGQGGLACCKSWGCKESDTPEWLNWTELNWSPNHMNLQVVNCQRCKWAFTCPITEVSLMSDIHCHMHASSGHVVVLLCTYCTALYKVP